ncbi:MAG: hypothetical protein J7K22_00220 [Nanoarchaeota archaeon]|nr:hypothetical protein [Nanoarchaeota archaeon]
MTKRWTAYKMSIANIVNGDFTEDGFVNYKGLQVHRVRIMGTVVSKFVADDRKYGFFVIDDGTETIRIRAFEDSLDLINKVEIGDIVDVFGRLRKYEDEIYVIPEIVVKINDPNWEILRKLELIKQDKQLENQEFVEEEIVVETKESKDTQTTLFESPRQKVVNTIRELDKGDGVEISEVIQKAGLEKDVVENVLTDLMNEGEIFEPRAGKVKLLE